MTNNTDLHPADTIAIPAAMAPGRSRAHATRRVIRELRTRQRALIRTEKYDDFLDSEELADRILEMQRTLPEGAPGADTRCDFHNEHDLPCIH